MEKESERLSEVFEACEEREDDEGELRDLVVGRRVELRDDELSCNGWVSLGRIRDSKYC